MRNHLAIRKASANLFLGFGLSIFLGVVSAIFFESLLPLLFPLALLIIFQVLVDYEKIYLLLFLCIPISTEVFISDHLATDLPTEPLIIGMMLIYILILIVKPSTIDKNFIKHPISIILGVHIVWIVITMFTSSEMGFSAKFLLAKVWYIITFFYFAGYSIKSTKRINLILWLIAIPLVLATTKVILHHATLDFGFKKINESTGPFFRNHVNYAAIISLFLPFIWYLHKWADSAKLKLIMKISFFVISFGIITAYTRAAYVAIFGALAAFWVIRIRLTKLAVVLTVISALGLVTFLMLENRFMEFVPSEQTVAHTELSDIVNSTSKLEDVSTMERYYRWIAASQMIAAKPIVGFGPGNFYHFYKQYTLERFATYVSDNPEKSGVHNYYLMTALEQGLIGLFIFVVLIVFVILYGEKVYHNTKDKQSRDLVMAALLSTIIIDAFLMINDMIETDKVGSFFFFNMAIVVLVDLFNKKEKDLLN